MPLINKYKKQKDIKECHFQYDITCIKKGLSEMFKGNSHMCFECRKIYNKDYYQRKKQKKSQEYLDAEELENELAEN